MSTQSDYTPEEWKSITLGPFLAGLYITMADRSGLGGFVKETMTIGKVIAEAGKSDEVEVVSSLVKSMRDAGFSGRPQLPDLPKEDDPAVLRNAMAEHMTEAAAAIAAKSPEEAEAYKNWLLSAAKRVSEAAKEGGFLGVGGVLVSEEEQKALEELAGTLGVSV